MDALFHPGSIAIAGASQTEGKLGNTIVKRVLADYQGQVFPINPGASEIAGVRAFPDMAALAQTVDLLIALLPGACLLPLVDSCANGQVKFLLAIPSGFGEVSREGKELQDAIVKSATQRGMRVVGPNCMGLLNGVQRLNASLVPDMPTAGSGFSFMTQSGGFGIAASMYALDHQLPIAKICDLGNTADVQPWEIMRYLKDDPDTRVVGIVLESVGDEASFIAELDALASSKPTIVTLLGRTDAGQRSSEAHLGLKSNPALIGKIGSTAADYAETVRDLFNLAKAICWQPTAMGNRVAIVTGTGGVGTELADLAIENRLAVPELSQTVKASLARYLPDYAGLTNPVDLTPIYWRYAEVYPAVIRVLLDAEEIDQVIVGVTDVATGFPDLAASLTQLEQERSADGQHGKPIFVFWGSRDDTLSNMRVLEGAKIPCFRTNQETIAVAKAMCDARPGLHDVSRTSQFDLSAY